MTVQRHCARMRRSSRLGRLAVGVVLIAGMPALAGSPGDPVIIDSGRFSVHQPPGDDWAVTLEPDRVFFRRDRHVDGTLAGTTAVLVLRTRPAEDECGRSAEETARDYCRDEEFDLWVSGQLTGLFGLEDVGREVVEIDGRQLYSMRYRQAFAEEFGGARTDNRMYMYFPASFRDDNYFYVFLQTEACLRDACPQVGEEMDETPIRSIMGSLETHAADRSD